LSRLGAVERLVRKLVCAWRASRVRVEVARWSKVNASGRRSTVTHMLCGGAMQSALGVERSSDCLNE
jgi:hypothetical protein